MMLFDMTSRTLDAITRPPGGTALCFLVSEIRRVIPPLRIDFCDEGVTKLGAKVPRNGLDRQGQDDAARAANGCSMLRGLEPKWYCCLVPFFVFILLRVLFCYFFSLD